MKTNKSTGKLFQALMLMLTIVLAFPMLTKAQSPNFREYTREFFSVPKTYTVKVHGIPMMGVNGVTTFNEGEATFTVTRNGCSYHFNDGSGSSISIPSSLTNVTVVTANGDISMPVYVVDSNTAIRAVKYQDGHCTVHRYTKNLATGKFVHIDWFNLKK